MDDIFSWGLRAHSVQDQAIPMQDEVPQAMGAPIQFSLLPKICTQDLGPSSLKKHLPSQLESMDGSELRVLVHHKINMPTTKQWHK